MRKSYSLLAILFSLIIFTNCSNDDNTSINNNATYQKLLGKWYFDEPEPTENNSFTFKSNGNVIYTYWMGVQDGYGSETGNFSINDDVLTMIFPETVTLTYVQKVVFVNDNQVEFQPTGNSEENAYEGVYFREQN